MEVGAGGALVEEMPEMIVVGGKVGGGVHDVHEMGGPSTAGEGGKGACGGGKDEGGRRPRKDQRRRDSAERLSRDSEKGPADTRTLAQARAVSAKTADNKRARGLRFRSAASHQTNRASDC